MAEQRTDTTIQKMYDEIFKNNQDLIKAAKRLIEFAEQQNRLIAQSRNLPADTNVLISVDWSDHDLIASRYFTELLLKTKDIGNLGVYDVTKLEDRTIELLTIIETLS